MASPESEVSRESEDRPSGNSSHPASPKDDQQESRDSILDDGTAADSPLSAVCDTSKKNGKHGGESDEEGEASDDGEIKEENGKSDAAEEGELEEGEVDEDEDGEQKSKNQVCKYYNKGQCTWGSHCRFIHPGYVDKGNYNMFEGLQKTATPTPADQKPQPSSQKVMISRDLQRPVRPRTPPQLLPLLGLPRLPIVPPDFFPPIPEPPRRETMWEKGVKQARHLAQAAAKKRDAMEDKMHGLADRFDPEFDESARYPIRNGFAPDDGFPPPPAFTVERRAFPAFTARNPNDFDQMTREREIRRHNNFMDQQQQLRNTRDTQFERRRSPPVSDLRRNLNDTRNQRPRAPDEWQDPWMRARSPGRQNRVTDRWVRRSGSPHGASRSPRSHSRSASKVSRTSRVSGGGSESRKRVSRRGSRSPKRVTRAPSGSPISSARSGSADSRSPSPVPQPPPREERSSPVSSRVSDGRGKFSQRGGSSFSGRQAKRKHEGSPISSASSRGHSPDPDDDGPRTPPPEEEENVDSAAEDNQRDYERYPVRRQHSGSPISPEHSDDNRRPSHSPTEPAYDDQRAKRFKKSHKPVKMTLQQKGVGRSALAALGTEGDDDENMDMNDQSQSESPTKFQHSSSVDLDRSSPLSDEGASQRPLSQTSDIAPDSSDKLNKRAELLAQLRAVEEAIARKKATKTTD